MGGLDAGMGYSIGGGMWSVGCSLTGYLLLVATSRDVCVGVVG